MDPAPEPGALLSCINDNTFDLNLFDLFASKVKNYAGFYQ